MSVLLLLFCVVGLTVAKSSEQECTVRPQVGPCKAALPRWYFDTKSGECKRFIYGGCGAKSNVFLTREACSARCASEEDCMVIPQTGRCRGFFPRWYFDPQAEKCKQFIYGGCGAKSNVFKTEEECSGKCSNGYHMCPPCMYTPCASQKCSAGHRCVVNSCYCTAICVRSM